MNNFRTEYTERLFERSAIASTSSLEHCIVVRSQKYSRAEVIKAWERSWAAFFRPLLQLAILCVQNKQRDIEQGTQLE